MTDINTLIAEMRAGLEGVTPGPWKYDDSAFSPQNIYAGKTVVAVIVGDSAETHDRGHHIARCSPANIAALLDEIEYWRADSALAWERCEERRLEAERLQSKLAVYDATNAAKVEKPR